MTASALISIIMIVSKLGTGFIADIFEWIDFLTILTEHPGRDGEKNVAKVKGDGIG